MVRAVGFFGKESVSYREFMEIFQGWNAHSKWADSYGLKKKILQEFQAIKKELKRKLIK